VVVVDDCAHEKLLTLTMYVPLISAPP